MNNNFLEELCFNEEAKNLKNSKNGSPKITPRAKYIKRKLKEHGIKVHVDKFIDKSKLRIDFYNETLNNLDFFWNFFGLSKKFFYFYNLEVYFPSSYRDCTETVIFTAHHDIVNPKSENCQDNTASVVNLMNFCVELKKIENKLKKNVLVVFTDCEEYGMKGANRLVRRINEKKHGEVKYIINSELTACGKLIWCEAMSGEVSQEKDLELNNKINSIKLKRRICPPNDSYAFRKAGISSYCFGLLHPEEFEQPSPKTWRVCHKDEDEYIYADENDMSSYVEFLLTLI